MLSRYSLYPDHRRASRCAPKWTHKRTAPSSCTSGDACHCQLTVHLACRLAPRRYPGFRGLIYESEHLTRAQTQTRRLGDLGGCASWPRATRRGQ
ncbi:hypothetical protein GY45DRAFT_463353 [Cubamyces sp. BRFM 1775]|nr:hypothetical protein GY45DRAFT_463353 [Cubamyces sp. BRFM 1775]